MATAALAVSITALILAVVMSLGYEYFRDWAARSFVSTLQVRPLENPISDGDQTYWVVELTVGRGNWACTILGRRARMNLSTDIVFEPEDETGDRYNSIAYEVGLGIRNKRILFSIAPNVTRQLIVVQRSADLSLRTLGDSWGYSHLSGSFTLFIWFRDEEGQIIRQPHRISSYIKHGNIDTAQWSFEEAVPANMDDS